MKISITERQINGNIRYVVEDEYGKVIDDAQGYGYKTRDKAWKCYWYQFYRKNANVTVGEQ